jgi:hypothetical protein
LICPVCSHDMALQGGVAGDGCTGFCVCETGLFRVDARADSMLGLIEQLSGCSVAAAADAP